MQLQKFPKKPSMRFRTTRAVRPLRTGLPVFRKSSTTTLIDNQCNRSSKQNPPQTRGLTELVFWKMKSNSSFAATSLLIFPVDRSEQAENHEETIL